MMRALAASLLACTALATHAQTAQVQTEDPVQWIGVKGGKVVLRTGGGETVEGSVSGDELAIDKMKFKKAALKN